MLGLVLAALLFTTPSAPTDASAAPDPGYRPLIGTWQCSTGLGSTAHLEFAIDASQRWLSFTNSWSNPKAHAGGSWQNFLYWDTATGTWTTSSMGSQGWAFSGTSDGWNNGALTFAGMQSTPETSFTARETLQLAADGSLTNEWEAQRPDGSWSVSSTSHCVKGAPSP